MPVANKDDPDQNTLMRRLVWVFVVPIHCFSSLPNVHEKLYPRGLHPSATFVICWTTKNGFRLEHHILNLRETQQLGDQIYYKLNCFFIPVKVSNGLSYRL